MLETSQRYMNSPIILALCADSDELTRLLTLVRTHIQEELRALNCYLDQLVTERNYVGEHTEQETDPEQPIPNEFSY